MRSHETEHFYTHTARQRERERAVNSKLFSTCQLKNLVRLQQKQMLRQKSKILKNFQGKILFLTIGKMVVPSEKVTKGVNHSHNQPFKQP